MRLWRLALAPVDSDALPRFLQIARAVTHDIRSGRLRPGDELPGTRTLAQELHVHRNTVAAAYDELKAEGWIQACRGQGTFVSRDLPDIAPKPRAASTPRGARVGYPLRFSASPAAPPWPAPRSGVLALAGIGDG